MPPPARKPQKIIRHRPGKAPAQEAPSSSSEDESSEAEPEQKPKAPQAAPPPKASSFVKQVTRAEPAPAPRPEIKEDDFETEEEESGSSDGSEGSSEDEDSSEEESSSEDDAAARRKLLRPMFVKKGNRKTEEVPVDPAVEEENRRKAEADQMIQDQLDRRQAAIAAEKKAWDDDEDVLEADRIDDTDGLDPEGEYAKWKLRELRRVKRQRDEIEEAEKEREEVERRRNLSAAEREAEDREHLDQQKAEREGRGKADYLKKYHHRGAFFQEETKEAGLLDRDIMGASYVDEIKDRSVLPEYLQVRDQTSIGRKGRQRHRDLKGEDTGRWGDYGDPRRREGKRGDDWVADDRFRPDYDRGNATGANAKPVSDRKRPGEDDDRERKRSKVAD